MMDVFIPENYVRKRRLEKKLAAKMASTKGSQTYSHWNDSNERIRTTMPRPSLIINVPLSMIIFLLAYWRNSFYNFVPY
jgi:hypothetical protein